MFSNMKTIANMQIFQDVAYSEVEKTQYNTSVHFR